MQARFGVWQLPFSNIPTCVCGNSSWPKQSQLQGLSSWWILQRMLRAVPLTESPYLLPLYSQAKEHTPFEQTIDDGDQQGDYVLVCGTQQ
jgi:hypothetical protein